MNRSRATLHFSPPDRPGYRCSASTARGLNIEDIYSYADGIASWLIDGTDSNYWLANNESGAAVNEFTFNSSHDNVTYQAEGKGGSDGVVHLEYNLSKTRMFGAGYGSQKIDIWNTAAAGTIQHLTSIPTNDTNSHPHQTVQSPCGKYAVVNDLGLDRLHHLDTTDDDAIHVTGGLAVPAGCGPRHGAFYMTPGVAAPTRYLVACETSHQVLVLNATDWPAGASSSPPPLQALDTAALAGHAGANLTAAELLLFTSPDRSADVYVSNRLTGDATDSVAHFRLAAGGPPSSTTSDGQQPGDLAGVGLASTGGVGPRGMGLSQDGRWLFVGNQQAGPAGLVVLGRDAASGALGAAPVASVAYEDFAAVADAEEGCGPQFVMTWGAGWAGAPAAFSSSNASAPASASRPTSTGKQVC